MIYFIQNKTNSAIKIGYTAGDAKERLAQLQTSSADRLVLLRSVPGEMWQEQELHKRLARYRLTGEWFRPHADVMNSMSEFTQSEYGSPELCHLVMLLVDHAIEIEKEEGKFYCHPQPPWEFEIEGFYYQHAVLGYETAVEACVAYIKSYQKWIASGKPTP